MKSIAWIGVGAGTVLMLAGTPSATTVTEPSVHDAAGARADNELIGEYCVRCHSDARLRGNLSLEDYDAEQPHEAAELTEKIIVKLRAGMMPPPGAPRPESAALTALAESLEARVDAVSREAPNPGVRSFQRLNRSEYERSVEELIGLRISAADWLPLDTKSENFDNIADVQLMSPTLLDAYLNAAADISRLAIGDLGATPTEEVYLVSGYTSQLERVEGAPFGTRGGVSVTHTFPADGSYVFHFVFEHTTTGDGFAGQLARGEQVEISINGERKTLLDMDAWMTYGDPQQISMRTDPISVTAGPQRVTAAFLKTTEGPVEDLVSPHDWSIADRHTGMSGYGLTLLPHIRELTVAGPHAVTGVSDNPIRDRIFHCRPTAPSEERACAEEIVLGLGSAAYRRALDDRDREALMFFYDDGAEAGGFEVGVRTALQAILASPHFVFRFEEAPEEWSRDESYSVAGVDLATRLSYFLWALPPDAPLLAAAERGDLADAAGLEVQVRRMLDDPRAEALGSRFAAQWLRLSDLEKVHPDQFWFPDFDQQLADAMRTETELLFNHLVSADRSIFELYDADYTFLDERLARHYEIDGVLGDEFRRVEYPGPDRRGILGHGSVLTLTSHANRTSPVLRGKWVMEVLMGTPPPPPPPGVPDLEDTEGAEDGRLLTTRERMATHRESPNCNSCHRFIDPIGLALDNYDVTGRWRIKENGVPLDTRGELYDGTPVETPGALVDALLKRPEPLVRTFTQNLMAYALGRRVEFYDQPTVRSIVRGAAEDGYRVNDLIVGVALSDAFRMQAAHTVADEPGN